MNIELPLDRTAQERLRPLSKAIFQSRYALEVILAVAALDRFYQAQVADLAGCRPNYASDFLRRLQHAELIEPLEREPGQVRHYYKRLPSPLWDFCAGAEELLAAPEAEVARLPSRPRGSP